MARQTIKCKQLQCCRPGEIVQPVSQDALSQRFPSHLALQLQDSRLLPGLGGHRKPSMEKGKPVISAEWMELDGLHWAMGPSVSSLEQPHYFRVLREP